MTTYRFHVKLGHNALMYRILTLPSDEHDNEEERNRMRKKNLQIP